MPARCANAIRAYQLVTDRGLCLDYYNVLSVSVDATDEEIRIAYKRAAMQWHPDRHRESIDKNEAEIKFKEIQQAYNTLSNQILRDRYDRLQCNHGTHQSPREQEREDEEFDSWRERYYPRGGNVKWKTTITLDVALNGGKISYTRKEVRICPDCDGVGTYLVGCKHCGSTSRSGRSYCRFCNGFGQTHQYCKKCDGDGLVYETITNQINIPKGVVDGSVLVVKKLGKQSKYFESGGVNGDLEIKITIKSKDGFKFTGMDVTGSLKVPYSLALLGGSTEIDLPTGKKALVNIQPRTNSGKKIRLSGMGLVNNLGESGDLILSVLIVLPKSKRRLTDEQIKTILDLEA